jgi:Ca2+/Na+ antiporter
MNTGLLNLLVLMVLGIGYMFGFIKLQQRFFAKFSSPSKNQAVLIVFISSLLMAGINLYHIADLTNQAFSFFLVDGQFTNAITYAIGYFAGMWIFSLIFFRLSYLVVGMLTHENEDVELTKNNVELAWTHAVILIVLAFVIAPALINIASGFIPYPKFPS